MNYKFLTLTSIALISIFTPQSTWSQTEENSREIYQLCSKFPNNSKCKGIEVPIPLKERSGEKVGCDFVFDPGEFEQKGGCKLVVKDGSITVYKEQGDKLELLEEQRATSEISIAGDRVFITNVQLWNKIRRWEVGFLPEEDVEAKNQTNFMVVYLDEKQAESLGKEIKSLTASKPDMVTEIVAASTNKSPNIQKLLETKECEYCDLSNADLSEVDLEKANLVGANLAGANLTGAELKGAYLLGANLVGADLTEANLEGVNLTFASLAGSTLALAKLKGINLQQANLQQANLEGADLSAPSLLQSANLSNTILIDANLQGANFQQANLQQANLEGADLSKTDIKLKNIPNNYSFGERAADALIGFPIFGLSSGGVDFKTSFLDADLSGANLSYTDLDQVSFENANLTNVNFSESNLELEDLEEVMLCGVTLADGSRSDRDCK